MQTKSVVVAYVFWLLLGIFGGHRFYLGHTWVGVLYLFTFGCLGIGWLIDLFLIPGFVAYLNDEAWEERADLEDRIDELEDEIDYLEAKLEEKERRGA